PACAVGDPEFRQAIGALLGPSLTSGNNVATLINGDRIFPAMLDAIRSAKKTITFETYIFTTGAVAREFADALSERARAGVQVRVILDAQGGAKSAALVAQMKGAGVEVEKYHSLRW